MNIKETNNKQLIIMCNKYINNRNSRGLSNEDVSKILNIPLAVLNDMENHIVTENLSTEYLLLLSTYFKVKLSDWFKT